MAVQKSKKSKFKKKNKIKYIDFKKKYISLVLNRTLNFKIIKFNF